MIIVVESSLAALSGRCAVEVESNDTVETLLQMFMKNIYQDVSKLNVALFDEKSNQLDLSTNLSEQGITDKAILTIGYKSVDANNKSTSVILHDPNEPRLTDEVFVADEIGDDVKDFSAYSLEDEKLNDDTRPRCMRAQIEDKIKDISEKLSQDVIDVTSPCSYSDYIRKKGERTRSSSMYEIKTLGVARLQKELDEAHQELLMKTSEVNKLTKFRDEVGQEIEELTASLFEEANKMVQDAHSKKESAEKIAKETNMKFGVLQDEVLALKVMVESFSNYSPKKSSKFVLTKVDIDPVVKQFATCTPITSMYIKQNYEVDPEFHQEFVLWRQYPRFNKEHVFMRRIYNEDINFCMCFKNKNLAENVLTAIENDLLVIETLKKPIAKNCALLEAPRFCKFKMKIDDENDHLISTLSRNRIAAVCDLFCYLRYIENGLIKSSIHEVYLEVLKKRRNIVTARLGLTEET